jgi:NitT/TauT family transport system substrate-binding protein
MKYFLFFIILLLPNHLLANEKIIFATNWVAQPEHGGFYQALADEEYKKCGIDVKIIQGGPGTNNRAKLVTGKIDLYMGGNLIQLINSRAENIPIKVLAGFFQKDPQIIMSHPDSDHKNWRDLKDLSPIYINDFGLITFYKWLENDHGFSSENRRPYQYNSAPFLANVNSAQQGYLTSEPYSIKKQIGIEPNIFLLADYGFDTYATTIEAMEETIDEKPEQIRCFIDASIIGWNNYLYGDSEKANEIIKFENPEMTDDKISNSIKNLKKYGIVDSGDTIENGIGYISLDRIKGFYNTMVKSGVVKELENIEDVYSIQFISDKIGLDIKKKLLYPSVGLNE